MKNSSLWAVTIVLVLAFLVYLIAANQAESPTGSAELEAGLEL